MICPSCQRDNEPKRRYCGRCGCNFEPACRGCGFANDHSDRFCGGCGTELLADQRTAVASFAAPAAAAPAAAAAVAAPAATGRVVDELAGLFAVPQAREEVPQLPEAGIGQADLDRLFGDGS